jgi:hypothetical protein
MLRHQMYSNYNSILKFMQSQYANFIKLLFFKDNKVSTVFMPLHNMYSEKYLLYDVQ